MYSKTKAHYTLCIFIALVNLTVTAQIPTNVNNLPCVRELLSEDFSDDIPPGWDGDFMLLDPPLEQGWLLGSGPTETPNTGPDRAFSGDYYLYMQASGPAVRGSVFSVRTPVIDLTATQEDNPSIRFRVLMYGAQTGALRVNVLSGPNFADRENVINIVGQQHTSGSFSNWTEAFVDISQYEGELIRVEFEGMKGTGALGDIAIDLFQVCNEPRIPTLSQWSVIILGLFLAIVGILGVRRKWSSRYQHQFEKS